MTVLREEPSLYPATLLEGISWPETARSAPGSAGAADLCAAGSDSASDSRWMVLYTKPRQEKALARDLWRHEVPFYLPLIKKTLRYHRNKVTSYSPLFSGYAFLYGTGADRLLSFATNRILRVIEVDDAEGLVRDLRQLYRMIAANVPLTVESRLLPGNRVRVRHGPFEGMEGTVLQRRGSTRLLVSVNFLQQGASIEIEDSLLEPLS